MVNEIRNEEWRDVAGYEGLYKVSNLGEVYSCKSNKKLKPRIIGCYSMVQLSKNNHKAFFSVHRLVAMAFIENPQNKPQVDHINGNKRDNRVENLRWASARENCTYAWGKKVICVEEQMLFSSCTEAAQWCLEKGITRSENVDSIRKGLNHSIESGGKRYGYHWILAEDDMGKKSREKGKRGEREVANILKEYGYDAKRGVQYQGSPDSPDVIGLPGVHLEVKRTERFDLYGAMDQAMRDMAQDDSEIPVVVHRRNGMDWVAVLPFREFLELYGKANG